MSELLSEAWLEALERNSDPTANPQLVEIVREQQRQIDTLRLKLDVVQRDREELRAALIRATQAPQSDGGEEAE
jgi:hypothetical protein